MGLSFSRCLGEKKKGPPVLRKRTLTLVPVVIGSWQNNIAAALHGGGKKKITAPLPRKLRPGPKLKAGRNMPVYLNGWNQNKSVGVEITLLLSHGVSLR